MADQWYGGQSNQGERWNVNLPAVVGVVFVFLLGVVIWVVVSSGGDDDPDSVRSVDTTASTVASPTTLPTATTFPLAPTVPPATSPQPMPATTPAPATAPPATAAPATAPPPPPATLAPTTIAGGNTTQPTAPPEQGDLGVPGHPIQRPPCDGGYITVMASAIGDEATPDSLDAILDRYVGSNYLRTDQTCPSLTPARNGQPIYVVYLGPYAVDSDACTARSSGPNGSYVRRLSNDLGPEHTVTCA